QNLTHAIRTLRRALLVFHSPTDELIDIDNARRIFDAARHPKSFVSLDDADHLLTRGTDAAYVADVLAVWASRYLGPRSRRGAAAGADPAVGCDATVVVTGSPKGTLAQEIRVRQHTLIADEPPDLGDDLGPTPYDLLLGSLGACTAMTLRLYARRKQWPLEQVSIRLTHDRVHANDSRDCEVPSCMIDHIERVVSLDGPLSAEQRRRILQIAEMCPVHRTLMGKKRIVTRLDGEL
ncbi:MAG: OsmC family protein, partial [Nitrososphaerales archaeon]